MNHQEYIREVPGARTAVLMIHGIVGTPDHFDILIPQIPEEWSVYNILLDGHGKGVEDFSSTSMEKWKKQVWDLFRTLQNRYDRVAIVAHSMGTLFAIQLGLEFPEKIPFLFLLAAPMRVGLRMYGVVNCLRVALDLVDGSDPRQAATRAACSIRTERRLWKYVFWLPRYLELFREIAHTRKLLPGLKIPCTAIQSQKDELVSNRAGKILERSGVVRVEYLPDSGHFYYAPEDLRFLKCAFLEIIEKHL